MTEVLRWMLPLAGGMTIGLVYFGGLWATVRRLPTSRRPALLTLASFVVRLGLAAAGFALLQNGDPRRLAVALVGLLVVRAIAVRRTRTALTPAGGR